MSAVHTALTLLAAASPPAGGAPGDQIGIVAAATALVVTGLLLVGIGHRGDLLPILAWAGPFSERVARQPGWAAAPCAVAIVALVTAVFGLYWDVSLHIDVGRDPGPLNNPAHYFILAGLYGIFIAGFLAISMPDGRPSAAAVKITRDWHAPLGGVLICACGGFALIAFPLDDLWHRLFGQDVTLWGPTHLMLLGGATMTLVGIAVLQSEAVRAMRAAGALARERRWVRGLRVVALPGGLLVGLSTFQGEFDFGVPQFRLVLQPMLIMLAAGVALVFARVWLGRGAAIGAALFFLAMRGALALIVGSALGESTPHFALYAIEALLVELAALVIAPGGRPLAFAAWCGALIGTIGLAAEWGWSHVWMPNPWPAAMLPDGAILGFAMALAGALIGAWIGARCGSYEIARTPGLRRGALAAAGAIAALVLFALQTAPDPGVSAQVTLRDVAGPPARSAIATVRLSPPGAARDADWLTATAWQGGGLVVDRLRRAGPGVYVTTRPIPLHGDWKTLIRLHAGASLTGVPIYLPRDSAIPAAGVAAPQRFTRPFRADRTLLRRESKRAPAGIAPLAYATVAAITLALLIMLAWGLHRLGRDAPWPPQPRPRPRPAAVAPPTGAAGVVQ